MALTKSQKRRRSKSGKSFRPATSVDRGYRSGLAKSGKGKRVNNFGGRIGLRKKKG